MTDDSHQQPGTAHTISHCFEFINVALWQTAVDTMLTEMVKPFLRLLPFRASTNGDEPPSGPPWHPRRCWRIPQGLSIYIRMITGHAFVGSYTARNGTFPPTETDPLPQMRSQPRRSRTSSNHAQSIHEPGGTHHSPRSLPFNSFWHEERRESDDHIIRRHKRLLHPG